VQALEILKQEKADLLILDLMMPKMDGIHAMMKIREDNRIPIIVLSAKTQDTDKILGLNLGADDYVEKPFNPLELIARVKSQIRRSQNFGGAPEAESREKIYTTGGLVINDDRKEVTVDGALVKLTRIEYNILLFLVQNKARYFPLIRSTSRSGRRRPLAQIIR
jgi:DNA-binding response OmpR family regulator